MKAQCVHSDTGLCENNPAVIGDVYPTKSFDLPSFTPPFRAQPEPCDSIVVASLGSRALLAVGVMLAFGAIVRLRRA